MLEKTFKLIEAILVEAMYGNIRKKVKIKRKQKRNKNTRKNNQL